MKLKVQYLENYQPNWEPLHYAKAGDSGMDLRAAIENTIVLEAGQRLIVPTGIICQMEAQTDCYEIQIRPRSGLAAKNGIIVVNTPGTVDWGYRGEIKVILLNTGTERLEIHPGDRIAQMMFIPVLAANLIPADELDDTARGAGGFGSTGTK